MDYLPIKDLGLRTFLPEKLDYFPDPEVGFSSRPKVGYLPVPRLYDLRFPKVDFFNPQPGGRRAGRLRAVAGRAGGQRAAGRWADGRLAGWRAGSGLINTPVN